MALNEQRLREMTRQFPENGLKMLLDFPGNVGDLLALGEAPMLDRLDLPRMAADPTTYITADYRHVSSDLVLTVPVRKGGSRKSLLPWWLTILIEHQSEPDLLMKVRVLEYLVQIWKKQIRDHGNKHGSLANVKLSPILSVVLHTGTYRWEQLGQIGDLMHKTAKEYRKFIPEFETLFISLPDTEEETLAGGGAFGQVLRVIQNRRTPRKRFEQVLLAATRELEKIAEAEQLRWKDLLCYLMQLVYHERVPGEREPLGEMLVESVRDNAERLELDMARKTIAQVLRREGAVEALRKMLMRQLQVSFGPLPEATRATIEATKDIEKLEQWIERIMVVESLDDMKI